MGSEGTRETVFLLPATGDRIEILPGSMFEVEWIYREIFEDDVYNKHGVAVRAGDVVVDVGANIGLFYLYAASRAATDNAEKVQQSVTYYGVEALPPVFEVLHRNVAGVQGATASGHDRIMNVKALLNVALGDQVRTGVPFTLFPLHPGNSTLNPAEKIRLQRGIVDPRFFEGATQYLVPMRTLSDVMEEQGIERVDFLKVDVEGAELMVLKGVKEAHWSQIWQVVVEVPDVDDNEVNNDGSIAPIKRVYLITYLLQNHGFVVNAEFDANAKHHMIYARRP